MGVRWQGGDVISDWSFVTWQATEQRKAAIKALQQWMCDFLYIARYALKVEKQQLEALGQVV